MAKRKTADDEVSTIETNQTDAPPLADVGAGESPQPEAGAKKSPWVERFGHWSDNLAGVHLTEDRPNRRVTLRFDAKPSEAVRTFVKTHPFGFKLDDEEMVWYKRINPAKPREARVQAEQLAFEAANMIRKEKGLEEMKGFSLAM